VRGQKPKLCARRLTGSCRVQGHVGSQPRGLQLLVAAEALAPMVRLAEAAPVLSVRGTAFYALGLLAQVHTHPILTIICLCVRAYTGAWGVFACGRVRIGALANSSVCWCARGGRRQRSMQQGLRC
jgi:hypothetical protein